MAIISLRSPSEAFINFNDKFQSIRLKLSRKQAGASEGVSRVETARKDKYRGFDTEENKRNTF